VRSFLSPNRRRRAFTILVAIATLAVTGIYVAIAANQSVFLDRHQKREENRREMRQWLRAAEDRLLANPATIATEIERLSEMAAKGVIADDVIELTVGKRQYFAIFRVATSGFDEFRAADTQLYHLQFSAFAPDGRRSAFGRIAADEAHPLQSGYLRRSYLLVVSAGRAPRLMLLSEGIQPFPGVQG
jgi:hypothetical protein